MRFCYRFSPTIQLTTLTNSITADIGFYGKSNRLQRGNVAEFGGLPFETIPVRFRSREKITSVLGGTVDARIGSRIQHNLLMIKLQKPSCLKSLRRIICRGRV